MLQARAGDRAAASTFIRRNSDRIARYLTRLLGKNRPIEDLTQDVFLHALEHADQYRPTAKVTTWLYRIATNAAWNHQKRASVRRVRTGSSEETFQVADLRAAAPDRQMDVQELRQRVAESVRALPINQRVALTLFEYEGCSYEQIAAVLDVTVEAVRSLLLRARTTLRRDLGGSI